MKIIIGNADLKEEINELTKANLELTLKNRELESKCKLYVSSYWGKSEADVAWDNEPVNKTVKRTEKRRQELVLYHLSELANLLKPEEHELHFSGQLCDGTHTICFGAIVYDITKNFRWDESQRRFFNRD